MSKPVGPYTPVVRAGSFLFVSGQLGLRDGELVPGGVADELRQALSNLGGLLESEGASIADVVKTTLFLRHMSDYREVNEVYSSVFADRPPARSAIGVAELPLGGLIEIEAVAFLPE